MCSFDDSRAEHYYIAAETMKQFTFKGVSFIMTITINKRGYLTREQIRAL
jgi:hypothetical protein